MVLDLFYRDRVGQKIDMAKRINANKIKTVLEMLKFVVTLDDPELIKCTIESIIETLQDELKNPWQVFEDA